MKNKISKLVKLEPDHDDVTLVGAESGPDSYMTYPLRYCSSSSTFSSRSSLNRFLKGGKNHVAPISTVAPSLVSTEWMRPPTCRYYRYIYRISTLYLLTLSLASSTTKLGLFLCLASCRATQSPVRPAPRMMTSTCR